MQHPAEVNGIPCCYASKLIRVHKVTMIHPAEVSEIILCGQDDAEKR